MVMSRTTTRPKVSITLSSTNMGDVSESDFDNWANWVSDHVDDACDVNAQVDQFHFGDASPDLIEGATDDIRDTIRLWLSTDAWNEWCAEGAP
jgi:hypothetical protein